MAKKKAAKRVTPRQRKKVLLALESDLARWLDKRAAEADATRTDTINLLLSMANFLEMRGYLRIGPGASVWFKPIPNPELVVEQVKSGQFGKLLDQCGGEMWPIGITIGREKASEPIGEIHWGESREEI